jgi:hypothetical protein
MENLSPLEMSTSIMHKRESDPHSLSPDSPSLPCHRKKEYANMGKGSSSTSTSSEEITPFEYIGMFLLVTVPLCFCISFLFFWRRFCSSFLSFPPSLILLSVMLSDTRLKEMPMKALQHLSQKKSLTLSPHSRPSPPPWRESAPHILVMKRAMKVNTAVIQWSVD